MKVILVFLLTCFFSMSVHGQVRVEKDVEILELLKIAESYKYRQYLSYNMEYTLSDSADPLTVLETVTGQSKINEGRFWTMLDSTELLQGQEYNLVVYPADSTILVNPKSDYGDFLKLPVLDSIFRESFIDSMRIDQMDSIRTLTIHFSPVANYSQYKMKYNRHTNMIYEVSFYLKNIFTEYGGTYTTTALVKLKMMNHSELPFPLDIFREDRFIYRQGQEIFGKGAYAGFKILNNVFIKPMPDGPANVD